MNLKKIAISLTASGLLFGSSFSVIGQTNNDSQAYLNPILDLLLNSSATCTAPTELVSTATADGNEGSNVPSRALDNNLSTRWSSDSTPSQRGGIITFELASTSIVTDISIAWFQSDVRTSGYSIERSTDNVNWFEVVAPTQSLIGPEEEFQSNDISDTSANFIRIIGTGNTSNEFTSISEVIINGCMNDESSSSSSSSGGEFNLDPNLQPWENFDLSVWGLDSPALRNISGEPERGTRIEDYEFVALSEGETNSDYDEAFENFFGTGGNDNFEPSDPYFFTGPDGGMVFKSPVDGGRTSSGARFPRSELREYVRGGVDRRSNGESISTSGVNENNWVLGYQPQALILDDNNRAESIQNVGGRNGRLTATLKVDKVTVTGRDDDIGVTIIGQIHAESDEPLRLYYRKLPDNELGSVYFIHEIREDMDDETPTGRDGDDLDEVNLVGSRDDDASNPIGGIALGEIFSYEVINTGSIIEVILYRGDFDGTEIGRSSFNMATLSNDGIVGSGYDRANEWMYFKAGAYTQNNVAVENGEAGAATTGFGPDGTEADYDQVTFYRLGVSHDSNDCSQCAVISD